jgi:hypothetical protein
MVTILSSSQGPVLTPGLDVGFGWSSLEVDEECSGSFALKSLRRYNACSPVK